MLRLQITDYRLQIRMMEVLLFSVFCSLFLFSVDGYAQEQKEEPIVVNGDTVEYSTTGKEVTATGNVSVTNKGVKLTCHKLTVNTQTKDGEAEGNVRLEDAKGVIEGNKIKYNFQTKSGTIIDSAFRANPYFGRAEKVDKVSDSEFIARRGYMTTCDFDKPHWHMKSNRMDIFPDDKIQTKDDRVYVGRVPVLYAPQFNKSLQDPLMHVQLMPGKRKDWGPYMLSAWRYNLTEDVKGRIYLDYRSNFGIAEGFGTNYSTSEFGKGDFKYYYTQERDHSLPKGNSAPRIFQRYLLRWRHQADIDTQTKFIGEFYKINDSKMQLYPGGSFNFLKDYFYREYEKQAQPPSYALLHHNFGYSSLDFLMQGRTNDWYDPGYVEKLPEIRYNLSSYKIANTPVYFSNNSSTGNYNKKDISTNPAVASSNYPDIHVNRFDTSNRLSLPMRIAFLSVSPFVMNRETIYDKTVAAASPSVRTIFYSGVDASTKLYRLFNVKTNLLGLDINGLRHIITPTVGYSFNKQPTIPGANLKQIDDVDLIGNNNSASLQLSNKLQTKRNNQSVDIVDFLVTTTYYFKPSTYSYLPLPPTVTGVTNGALTTGTGTNFGDLLLQLKLIPYSWMSINSDATYVHSGDHSSVNYNHFANANYDLNFNLGTDRSFGVGQRYQIKGGNEITGNLVWRFNPKWKFTAYERYNRGHDPTLGRGLREQEYTVSRDLHCWVWDITYNTRRGHGDSIYFIFRLKAFPELGFNFNESYHEPKPGSQSGPQIY